MKKFTQKWCIKQKMKKGQTMKNPSKFKLDCPNKLQMFSSTFTIVVSRVNEVIESMF